jgi:hypothetical protein
MASSTRKTFSGADGNGNGMIDADDYLVWKAHYGESLAGGALQFASIPSTPPAMSAPLAVTDSAARSTTPGKKPDSATSFTPKSGHAASIEPAPAPLQSLSDPTTRPIAPGTLERLFAGWSGADRFRGPHRVTSPSTFLPADATSNPLHYELLYAAESRVDRRSAAKSDDRPNSADRSEAHDDAFGEWEGVEGLTGLA